MKISVRISAFAHSCKSAREDWCSQGGADWCPIFWYGINPILGENLIPTPLFFLKFWYLPTRRHGVTPYKTVLCVTMQCMYNVTFGRVRVTIVAVELSGVVIRLFSAQFYVVPCGLYVY